MSVNADSGWDSSRSSGGDDSGLPILFVAMLFILFMVSLNNISHKHGRDSSSKFNNYKYIDISKIMNVDPNFNIYEFKNKVFSIYRDIQTAWMDFDYNTIRILTTDEIYNMYITQLETLKLKKQKNIMKDISLEEVKIINVNKNSNIITIDAYLRVKCYDYVIKESTGETVRGNNKNKIIIEYVLTFVKSSVNDKKEEKCPNCGAQVEIVASNTCPYCKSVLVKDASDYVMSKKTCVGQHLDR